MTLKEKMKRGPVFGMACFTGTTCVIENIAMSGLDFIYLDLEHTNYMLDEAFFSFRSPTRAVSDAGWGRFCVRIPIRNTRIGIRTRYPQRRLAAAGYFSILNYCESLRL